MEHLDGAVHVQRKVVGQVNLAKCPLPQQLFDAIFARQNVASE